jgi:hypothetical protein
MSSDPSDPSDPSDRAARDREQLELRATLASQKSGRAEARRVREKAGFIVETARRPAAKDRKRQPSSKPG